MASRSRRSRSARTGCSSCSHRPSRVGRDRSGHVHVPGAARDRVGAAAEPRRICEGPAGCEAHDPPSARRPEQRAPRAPRGRGLSVKPAPFEYHRPGTLDEALVLMTARAGEVRPLAGGQSLIPAMNFRLARPAALVDLNRVAELAYVRPADGGLRIGAMARQRVVERSPLVQRAAPLLAEAMPFIAHPQIRNRGTVGGSLAHADPAAELPAVMLALDARLEARSWSGARTIPASAFFTGLFGTALTPDELLVEIALPPL